MRGFVALADSTRKGLPSTCFKVSGFLNSLPADSTQATLAGLERMLERNCHWIWIGMMPCLALFVRTERVSVP